MYFGLLYFVYGFPKRKCFLSGKYLNDQSMDRKIFKYEKPTVCLAQLKAIHDTMDILSGKWKITIIGCLHFGTKQFMDLQREVEGIGPKMLSKELRELEINGLVNRAIQNTKPITVKYSLTDYGETLRPIILAMATWGTAHRKRIIGGEIYNPKDDAVPAEIVL